jgi:hypothetical protein
MNTFCVLKNDVYPDFAQISPCGLGSYWGLTAENPKPDGCSDRIGAALCFSRSEWTGARTGQTSFLLELNVHVLTG